MEKTITIYGTPSCSKCLMVKSKLEKKGIEFTYVNIKDFSDNEMTDFMKETDGLTSLPIIKVDGVGFVGMDYVNSLVGG